MICKDWTLDSRFKKHATFSNIDLPNPCEAQMPAKRKP